MLCKEGLPQRSCLLVFEKLMILKRACRQLQHSLNEKTFSQSELEWHSEYFISDKLDSSLYRVGERFQGLAKSYWADKLNGTCNHVLLLVHSSGAIKDKDDHQRKESFCWGWYPLGFHYYHDFVWHQSFSNFSIEMPVYQTLPMLCDLYARWSGRLAHLVEGCRVGRALMQGCGISQFRSCDRRSIIASRALLSCFTNTGNRI